MRPRKKVLVFTTRELDAATVIFAIDTRGLRAHAVHTADAFAAQIPSFAPDGALVFFDGPQDTAAILACQSAAHAADVPLLLAMRGKGDLPAGGIATMTLPRGLCSMMEILNALRTIVARKRGPKKGTTSVNAAAAIAAGRSAAAGNERLYA